MSEEHWQDILQKAKDDFTYTPPSEPCPECKQITENAPDINLFRMMNEIQADKERQRYNKLSIWGKLKFKLHKFWNRLRHKQPPQYFPEHSNCRCYLQKVECV